MWGNVSALFNLSYRSNVIFQSVSDSFLFLCVFFFFGFSLAHFDFTSFFVALSEIRINLQ